MLDLTDGSGDPLDAVTFDALRGTPSTHQTIQITNPGASTVSGVKVTMMVEKTPMAGDYADAGHPAADERWGRFQVVGVDSTGTPGQTVSVTGAQPMGYLAQAVLPPILPGDTIVAEVWIDQPSTSAGGGAVRVKFAFDNDSPATPVPAGVTDVARGIIPGTGVPESLLISGCGLTVSGTPDDKVHVDPGSWVYQGDELTDGSTENVTLDQTDFASATLASGESYYAAITRGSGTGAPNAYKGLKGTSPDKPDIPIGELLLGYVKVDYQSGGTSIIDNTDLSQEDLTYGRYAVTYGATGLDATVHTGRALTANYMQRRDVKGTLTLTDAATNRIWLLPTGLPQATTTADVPMPGALLLATATTSGGNVTGSTDERVYVGGTLGSVPLHAITHHAGGTDQLTAHDVDALSTADGALLAPLADPVFTGNPTGPTPTAGDNSPSLATTAFVQGEITAALRFKDPILFPGDGSSQPSVISDKPTSDNLFVYVNGLLMVHDPGDAGAQDYNYNPSTGQITHTPVLAVGMVAQYRYIA